MSADYGALPPPGVDPPPITSGEFVRRHLRRLIFSGVLKHEQRLDQEAIARTLGVSRSPVREALIALEREGWITIITHHGAYVNQVDERGVTDHFELLGLILGFAVRRGCERQGAMLATQLASAHERIVAAGENSEDLFRATTSFHGAVVTAANSPRLLTLLTQLSTMVPGNFFELVPGSSDVERQGLADVLRAVERADVEAAVLAYAAMIRKEGELVLRLLHARGSLRDSGARRHHVRA